MRSGPAILVSLACLVSRLGVTFAQQDDLGAKNGFTDIQTANFKARIVRDSQVLASLQLADGSFDFLPFDLLSSRSRNGQYHWGDITYRYRKISGVAAGAWIGGDSASARKPVTVTAQPGNDGNGGSPKVLAASSLSPTLPSGTPLNITREWLGLDGDLALRFTIANTDASSTVELGSLGFPAEFNSIFANRRAEDMQKACSLSDPYIGMDAGHIRVAPIKGRGPALAVTPLTGTKTPLEAYRNLAEPQIAGGPAYGSQTFEGFYEWQVLTRAWAENEWRTLDQSAQGQAGPWNPPSSRTLAPGQALQFGLRFTVASGGVRDLDKAIRRTGNPVAMGVPGYIVPRDLPAQLYLQSDSPVRSFGVSPSGALTIKAGTLSGGNSSSTSTHYYTVTPSASAWGRTRLTIEYADGRVQTVHYFVTKPSSEALGDMGHFLTTLAYYNSTSDPFGRAPSVMTYDHDKGSVVEQDPRAWVAGLSDEGGAGAYLAALMKQVLQPSSSEVARLDAFVNQVLWGRIQLPDHSVRKSIFYYDRAAMPGYGYDPAIDWSSWTSWNRQNAFYIDRAYNYVHPAAAYWALYRVARSHPGLTIKHWSWYLDRAHGTVMRCARPDIFYNDMGLMGETVFGEILLDLEREGGDFQPRAQGLAAAMRSRLDHWRSVEVPYGSEMAWDSTGQEGVYYWARHFGETALAGQTVDSVLGFTPTVPHWGWNGNARRYWDFNYAGKLRRTERQIHHYGSGLNSQVLLSAFRSNPSDSYLLRVGHGGSWGPLSNIHSDGFPSAAFHSFPDTLRWDGITGDYGPGFLGMALGSGTYIGRDADLGGNLVAYGGFLELSGGNNSGIGTAAATVIPKDPVRKRAFIGPLSLLISLDAGVIERLTFDESKSVVSLTITQLRTPDAPVASAVVVWLESTLGDAWRVVAATDGVVVTNERSGWRVPLSSRAASVTLDVRLA